MLSVHYFAAARQAAGCAQEQVDTSGLSTVGELLEALCAGLTTDAGSATGTGLTPDTGLTTDAGLTTDTGSATDAPKGSTAAGMPFEQVIQQCSFLLDGAAATPQTSLAGAKRLDVLPPFAGG